MTTSSFRFRPLTEHDFPLLERWFNAPHARRWYRRGTNHDEIVEEYGPIVVGNGPIRAFVVLLRERPIGLVEWLRVGDLPAFQRTYRIDDPNAANCDVILGEPDVVHRGLGPAMIRAFLAEVVFADPRGITQCVIDPEVDNVIAIRAYEKAGFRFVRALADDGEGNTVYLMALSREELASLPAEPAFYVRPGRPHELSLACEIDDDATVAYADAGIHIDLPADHPFLVDEMACWAKAADSGGLLFAVTPDGQAVGFVAMGHVDGKPHLAQLSVRRAFMRKGIGRALVERAIVWSVRAGELWMTTYDATVPWNEPWYTRLGFRRAHEQELGVELQRILATERDALPRPEARIAMVYRHPR